MKVWIPLRWASVEAAHARACGAAKNLSKHGRCEDQGQGAESGAGEGIGGRVQSGEGEEHRHQHDDRNVFNALHQTGEQAIVTRQDSSDQKGTEHGMQSERTGRRRTGEDEDQDQREHAVAGPAIGRMTRQHVGEPRAQHPERKRTQGDASDHGECESRPAGMAGNQCHHKGEHDPGQHIGKRGRGQ